MATTEKKDGIYFKCSDYTFFVSKEIIPKSHITLRGENIVIDSYGLDKGELICKEIFRKKKYVVNSPVDVSKISDRMQELYYILESEYKSEPCFEENIHWIALLGAVARLFTALNESEIFSELLNVQFKNGVRNTIYHCQGPFSDLSGPELITFFSHCYEHCRLELSSVLEEHYKPLTRPIDLKDRKKFYFTSAVDYSMQKSGIRSSEIKNHAKGRAANAPTDFGPTSLTIQEENFIRNEYENYIQCGVNYRHNNESPYTFLKLYGINAYNKDLVLDPIIFSKYSKSKKEWVLKREENIDIINHEKELMIKTLQGH